MEEYNAYMDSPMGILHIRAGEKAIHGVERAEDWGKENGNALTGECKKELAEYFSGKRKIFTLPLAPEGTEWRQKVWKVLEKIPYGKTLSYGEVAEQAGNPKGARAAGGAIHNNPILILIPCHRVIGKDGSLTGYAEGLDKKAYLLDLERREK